MSALIQNPVWKTGPLICVATWMPAYESAVAAKKFTETMEGDFISSSWLCGACGKLHFEPKIRPPSGATSGSGREPWPDKGIEAAKRLAKHQLPKFQAITPPSDT